MFTFCKARGAKRKKILKENHTTKVTKISKTRTRKYGMNETEIAEKIRMHGSLEEPTILLANFAK